MSLHLELSNAITSNYGEHLLETPQVSHDAILVRFSSGLSLECRFANQDEYSVAWQWQDKVFRIDTAPVHSELNTFPNHMHLPDGTTIADPLTEPGRLPWDNLDTILKKVIISPELS